MRQIESAAHDFESAARTIRGRDHFDINWPTIPKTMLADEIGRWCNSKRSDLMQNVSATYKTLLAPVQWAWGSFRNRMASKQQQTEQQEELTAVMQLVEKTIDQLKLLGISTSNRVLKDELNQYLIGAKRKELLAAGERIHSQIPPKTDAYMRGEVYAILNRWAEENPEQWQTLHKIDVAALGTHAVLSVGAIATCGVLGVAALGSIGLSHVLITGCIYGSSEALLKILGEEVRMKIAELKVAIQKKYAAWRKGIFLERFESELWGEMLRKFDAFAAVSASKEYLDTTQALASVRNIMSAMK